MMSRYERRYAEKSYEEILLDFQEKFVDGDSEEHEDFQQTVQILEEKNDVKVGSFPMEKKVKKLLNFICGADSKIYNCGSFS